MSPSYCGFEQPCTPLTSRSAGPHVRPAISGVRARGEDSWLRPANAGGSLKIERTKRFIVTAMVTSMTLLGGVAVAWADTSSAPSATADLTALPDGPTTELDLSTSVPEAALFAASAAEVSTQVSPRILALRQIALAKKPWGARSVAKVIAKKKFKWGSTQFACLNNLWTKESGWRYRAHNSRSGAYGIPQAHPGSKMASVARDWRTNPVTQIHWGLKYIDSRYNTPCSAWSKFKRSNWY